MSELTKKECIRCKGGVSPLKGRELTELLDKLGGVWRVLDEHHVEKEFDQHPAEVEKDLL